MFITSKTMYRWLAHTICMIKVVECGMESFISGGEYASIYMFPHSAFMKVHCKKVNGKEQNWICGASIVNQRILMTAAHCLAYCTSSTRINIAVGNDNREHGDMNTASSFLVHGDYNAATSYADIGLVKMTWRLRLNLRISRVALMRHPPRDKEAAVAGWGLIDEEMKTISPYLKYINQTVRNRRDCQRRIRWVPHGCICASSSKKSDYASSGDSGSALVVDGYIQIGIVSHKLPEIARNVIVYTEIAYYYNWIKENMNRIYCAS